MNSVHLIGNLTRDPEVRYTASQMAVATFTIAINRMTRPGEEAKADFPRITVFGKQAETCEKYLAKGRKVAIEGRIQTGSYQDKETGKTIYTTDVVANRVEFLGGQGQQGGGQGGYSSPNFTRPAQPDMGAQPEAAMPDSFQAIDEDVPF